VVSFVVESHQVGLNFQQQKNESLAWSTGSKNNSDASGAKISLQITVCMLKGPIVYIHVCTYIYVYMFFATIGIKFLRSAIHTVHDYEITEEFMFNGPWPDVIGFEFDVIGCTHNELYR
jgi:hypothetical protein